eukprot:12413374-Karenia_brevis.AAC.1
MNPNYFKEAKKKIDGLQQALRDQAKILSSSNANRKTIHDYLLADKDIPVMQHLSDPQDIIQAIEEGSKTVIVTDADRIKPMFDALGAVEFTQFQDTFIKQFPGSKQGQLRERNT